MAADPKRGFVVGLYEQPNEEIFPRYSPYIATSQASELSGCSFVTFPLAGARRAFHPPTPEMIADLSTVGTDLADDRVPIDGMRSRLNGLTSPWIDCDHPDKQFAAYSMKQLDSVELANAEYLAFPSVLIEIRRRNNPNLVRILRKWLWLKNCRLRFWIILPSSIQSIQGAEPGDDVWSIWAEFRSQLFNYSQRKLAVGIRFGAQVDEEFRNGARSNRWIGEPLEIFWFDELESLFHVEEVQKNYSQYEFLRTHFHSVRQRCMITGGSEQRWLHAVMRLREHMCAAANNNRMASGRPTKLDQMDVPFEQQVQRPLQPADVLLSAPVYTCFEEHTGKYKRYEEAILEAVDDLFDAQRASNASPPTIFVVGAGRGGLVKAVTQAENRFHHVRGYDAKCWTIVAVERNPFPLVTLEDINRRQWEGRVQIVRADLRDLRSLLSKIKQKADVIVSEMLGSFGCNELEPEVLEVMEREFCHEHTIMIPQKYTSFIEPIHSMQTMEAILNQTPSFYERFYGKPHPKGASASKTTDKVYVIPLRRVNRLEAVPRACFTFEHPAKDADFGREAVSTFQSSVTQDITGFAGYFDVVLYNDIRFSTLPDRQSFASSSWFPAFFPVRKPVRLPAGSELSLKMCRCSTKEGVWYEWQQTVQKDGVVLFTSNVQNAGGASDFARLPPIEEPKETFGEEVFESEEFLEK